MKTLQVALFPLACILAVGSLAASAAGNPTIVMANQAKYGPAPKPYPAEAKMAVLSGDPGAAGSPYTVRLELPSGTKIAAHTHGDTENVTVIRGTLMVGVGSSFNASKMIALTPGSYASIPAETPHYAMAKGETVVQVNGVGPSSTVLTGQ
jgi:quercetin dioxygenase-like cupin family protein